MGARNKKTEKRKSGRKRGRRKAVQRRLPRARAAFCREEAVCGVRWWKGVCLSRRPRAQRAGDGAASAAPSAKPPTCSRLSHIFMDSFLYGYYYAEYIGRFRVGVKYRPFPDNRLPSYYICDISVFFFLTRCSSGRKIIVSFSSSFPFQYTQNCT